MNKNTTNITLSAYFNDVIIGYYEDEDLVKQFGRQLGFDVDLDTFMAVSFQYPSDMRVAQEDREKLMDAAETVIALSEINKKIETKQIITEIKPGQSVGIFIGPEGGFEKEEVEAAIDSGAKAITLGKRILRTETAGLTTLSVLMFHLEQN